MNRSVAGVGGPGNPLPGAGPPGEVPLGVRERVDPGAFADAVLALTRQIPAARVLTYGDVSELLECGGPRQVGKALSQSTVSIPWWRVLRSGGHPARGLAGRARPHYEDEGTPLSLRDGAADPTNYRVDLLRGRWTPTDVEHEAIDRLVATLRTSGQRSTPGTAPGASNVRGV